MRILNVLKWMIIVLVIILVVVIILWCMISTGKVGTYYDENGEVLKGSLKEKRKLTINGAENGLFINSKDVSNPVLLFVSSGPGTDDYFFNEKYPDMHLEDEFTVAYWDYRGMGIAYDPSIDPQSITGDVLIKDTLSVTEYLKERFGKEKIYIMGFSGGTQIALQTIAAYPDNYIAYIGMAQVVTDSAENDTLIYNFMKDIFTQRKDKKSLKKLENGVTHMDDQVKCKDWDSFIYLLHKAGGGTTYNETETKGIVIPLLLSHCYTPKEKIDYIFGMKMYRKTAFKQEMTDFDYRDTIKEIKIPVYFLSGCYDFNSPWPLVEDYCNQLKAPDKEFYKIQGAAHSPLWEQVEESHKVMVEIKEKTNE